jgi:hypothetical protein
VGGLERFVEFRRIDVLAALHTLDKLIYLVALSPELEIVFVPSRASRLAAFDAS